MDEPPFPAPARKTPEPKPAPSFIGEHNLKYATDWQQIIKICLWALFGFVLLCAAFSGSRPVWGVQMKSAVVMAMSISNGIDQFVTDYGHLPLSIGNAPADRDLDSQVLFLSAN
jgi:hypothetical protein